MRKLRWLIFLLFIAGCTVSQPAPPVHRVFGTTPGCVPMNVTGAQLINAINSCLVSSGGSSGSPALPNGSIQYNNSGIFGGLVPGNTLAAHNFATSINATLVLSGAQPSCGDLSNAASSCSIDATNAANIGSGTLSASRLPALSGDTTTTAGTSVTSTLALHFGASNPVALPSTAPTQGGMPYFSSTTALAYTGLLTANTPVIGGGSGAAPASGTVSGNTTKFVTMSGTSTTGDCPKFDANGNVIDQGAPCGFDSAPTFIIDSTSASTSVPWSCWKTPRAIVFENWELTVGQFTCSVNPVVSMCDTGTSASPTACGTDLADTATITATGNLDTVLTSSVNSGHYVCAFFKSGTCTVFVGAGNASAL